MLACGFFANEFVFGGAAQENEGQQSRVGNSNWRLKSEGRIWVCSVSHLLLCCLLCLGACSTPSTLQGAPPSGLLPDVPSPSHARSDSLSAAPGGGWRQDVSSRLKA